MNRYREIIRLLNQGISQRNIALSCQCSRNTVSVVAARAQETNLKWPLPAEVTDADLEKQLLGERIPEPDRVLPDWEKIRRELLRKGVTLKLLWTEYCEETRMSKKKPLMYSRFCDRFRDFMNIEHSTMHIDRKPGERVEVDWAGQTIHVTDHDTGELIPAHVFVSVCSYSLYTYVEACFSQDLDNWIQCHVNMLRFYGGVPQMIVPDNLKTGVDRIESGLITLNRTYQEMAEHYGTAVLPARVRHPKDKPGVEGAVKTVSSWILSALRNHKFFTLADLNVEIKNRLKAFNERPFHKKEGSRYSVFLGEEKLFLSPLPATHFEPSQWKVATVQFNYHIEVEKMHYSVPYEFIKEAVDVRLTKNVVEVFVHQTRIASHVRLMGRPGQYSTLQIHMPEDHQKYLEWDAKRFLDWGTKIGPATVSCLKAILASHKIEQQAYRSCMGLLKLADKHSVSRLEASAAKALTYTSSPSFKNIKNILLSGLDKPEPEPSPKDSGESSKFGFTRGAGYYGGDRS
jgi:transposase